MKLSEITNRVAEDKARKDFKEDANKPNKRKAWEDRRKVEARRNLERRLEERRVRQYEGYE